MGWWLFNLDPVEHTLQGVLWLMFIYLATGIVVRYVWHHLSNEPPSPDWDGQRHVLAQVTIFGVLEEIFFRGIPIVFFGSTGGVIGTVIWAFIHVPTYDKLGEGSKIIGMQWSYMGMCIFFGIFLLRLWLDGMWLEAMIIHGLWNLVIMGIHQSYKFEECQKKHSEYEERIVDLLRRGEQIEEWLSNTDSVSVETDVEAMPASNRTL